MTKRRKLWKKTVGPKGATVRVFERTPGGVLYIAAWDPHLGENGGMRKRSLKHSDKDTALVEALEQSAKLQRGEEAIRSKHVTVALLFAQYLEQWTPTKAQAGQKADARRSDMWSRFLGGTIEAVSITPEDWYRFQKMRKSGAIDCRGNRIENPTEFRPVRARTIQADCQWLRLVYNWAENWEIIDTNPLRRHQAFKIEGEVNVRRPVASQDRYETLLEAVRLNEYRQTDDKRRVPLGYLPELLPIVNGTGRRISAVCQLRYQDLQVREKRKARPHGAIRWPSDTDKTGKESLVPIGPEVRAAIDRILEIRPGIGPTPIFPSMKDATKPITRFLATTWLRKAEKLAGLAPQRGGAWHPYRRKWATERKHLPDADVMTAGGWAKGSESFKTAYQHADEETMLHVVLSGGALREAK